MQPQDYVRWFDSIRLGDVAVVGGKNASLGELYVGLSARGVRVPNGFAFTAQAYRDALTAAGAWEELHRLLDHLDKRNVAALRKRAVKLKKRTALLRKLKTVFRRYQSQPVDRVVQLINPILSGWVNYF